jgi:hypothetical protein
MAFVRTLMVIVALLLGWTAIRSQPSAHILPVAGQVEQ